MMKANMHDAATYHLPLSYLIIEKLKLSAMTTENAFALSRHQFEREMYDVACWFSEAIECCYLLNNRVAKDKIPSLYEDVVKIVINTARFRNNSFADAKELIALKIAILVREWHYSTDGVQTKDYASMSIKTGMNESEQTSNFQNATLHSATDDIAVSIAVYPSFPEKIKSEEDVKIYMQNVLASLCRDGWQVEVQIGLNTDNEPD